MNTDLIMLVISHPQSAPRQGGSGPKGTIWSIAHAAGEWRGTAACGARLRMPEPYAAAREPVEHCRQTPCAQRIAAAAGGGL